MRKGILDKNIVIDLWTYLRKFRDDKTSQLDK